MSTDKEIKKEEKEIQKTEKAIEKEIKTVDKAIAKDEKKLEKVEQKLATDVEKHKAETVITKDEVRKTDVVGDLNKHTEEKRLLENKLENLHGSTGVAHGAHVTDVHSHSTTHATTTTGANTVLVKEGAVAGAPVIAHTTTTTQTTTAPGVAHGAHVTDVHSHSTGHHHHGTTGATTVNEHVREGGQTVQVIEHVHPTEREERVIRHDEGVDKKVIVDREIIPEHKVEVHKHVHPVEKVDIHEHHKQKETEIVKEHVHQTHVKEVHEHVRPETHVEVKKEVVHPEKVYETHKSVDLGETKRTVVDEGVVHKTHHT